MTLRRITEGFAAIHAGTGRQAVALSVAFPGAYAFALGEIAG